VSARLDVVGLSRGAPRGATTPALTILLAPPALPMFGALGPLGTLRARAVMRARPGLARLAIAEAIVPAPLGRASARRTSASPVARTASPLTVARTLTRGSSLPLPAFAAKAPARRPPALAARCSVAGLTVVTGGPALARARVTGVTAMTGGIAAMARARPPGRTIAVAARSPAGFPSAVTRTAPATAALAATALAHGARATRTAPAAAGRPRSTRTRSARARTRALPRTWGASTPARMHR